MKKLIAMLLVLALALSFAACGTKDAVDSGSAGDSQQQQQQQDTPAVEEEAADLTKNDNVTIQGIYVDKSYVDKESSALKMVYVFFTLKATDTNLSADSKYTKMTIGGANTYDSDFYKGSCEYAPSYYYSSFIEDVYVGTELKVALTFKIPEGDLQGSKEIVFSDSSMPFDGIKMSTDDVVFCENPEEVCSKGDAEGYATEMDKHAPVDEETANTVKNLINGYYWTYYVSAGSTVQTQEIEFSAPNNFEVRSVSLGVSNGGTYEVKKAYIYVTYDTNGRTYKIPYEIKDGEVEMDCATAFSIYE